MPDNGPRSQPPRGPGNKPPSPGISQDEHRKLVHRLERVERTLQEHYAEKNQWNSMVREWVGTPVTVWFSGELRLSGTLLWVDRYTLCLEGEPPGVVVGSDGKPQRAIVVHKGLVAFMHQS